MNMTRILLFALLALYVPIASAADDAEWASVVAAFSLANARGDLETLENSFAVASKYVQKYPSDGRAKTYRGSIAVMKARELSIFWLKLSSLNQGLSWMDEGISAVLKDKRLAGGRVEVDARMVRGITCAQIPRLFGRSMAAHSDFMAVIASSHFIRMNQSDRASVYAWLAVLSYRQKDDAISEAWLRKARAEDVSSANAIWEQYK